MNYLHKTEKQQLPSHSSDLNPLDHYAWGIMAKKSEVKGSSKAKKVSKIKTALRMIWENLPQVQATKLFQVLKKD